jgi:uncharacterized SAM-binding protein YcdF (DUF218 family)
MGGAEPMSVKNLPAWSIAVALLVIAAAFFLFCMRGYTYIGYTLLFIAALVLVGHFGSPLFKRWVIILVSLGLMYFCVVELPILDNARTDSNPERKYLIVLGAAVHGDTPSLALTHRLEGALDYLNSYPDSVAIVSGGKGNGENITEAECMYQWLVDNGVDSGRIICEDKATSTMENLKFSFEIIRSLGDEPDGNVALLSSSYHLYRAKTMAGMLGAKAVGVAGYPGLPIYMINCYIREAFGVTHLWVLGD